MLLCLISVAFASTTPQHSVTYPTCFTSASAFGGKTLSYLVPAFELILRAPPRLEGAQRWLAVLVAYFSALSQN